MFWCRFLTLLVFVGGLLSSPAAASTAENNAFESAAKKFNLELWSLAAHDFATFVTNHPTSFRVPEAILYQSQALVKDRQYSEAAQVLQANQHRAIEFADHYLYWIGQAHMGNSNYPAAARAFGELVSQHSDSTYRLEAAVRQATALARTEAWSDVATLLAATNGAFQAEVAAWTNDWTARGWILLGEAHVKQSHLDEAARAVSRLEGATLNPELAWRRLHLQTRIDLAAGRLNEARTAATNLLPLAQSAADPALRAESFVLLGGILERMRRYDEAVTVYEQNLTNAVPASQQRTALLKIAELSLLQNNATGAVRRLEQFQRDFPRSEASDGVLLALGELQLKQATSGRQLLSNQLALAQSHFDALITNFPSSGLLGKAWLGKGWCLWYSTNFPLAELAFRNAIKQLRPSEDQAIARFKLADTYFSAGEFQPALETYGSLVADYATTPQVKAGLLEQALYQTVRAALALTNLPVAREAVDRMLAWYPDGLMGDRCLFLVAEGYAQRNETARARELLKEFEERFGAESPALLPQVRMAVARSFEKEGNWTAAITNYNAWISTFTNHVQLPEVLFARAWDTSMAGDETNAFQHFKDFITGHPQHELVPRARWWIGDYFFKQGRYGDAEEYYPYTTNYATSDLYFRAHLRAGAAAMARLSYKDALSYFTNLLGDPRCPPDLKVRAAVAAGDACMVRTEAGATNRLADLEEAAAYFNLVLRLFPTNSQVPLAWGRLGDCFKEMGTHNARAYDRAIEAYSKVATLPSAATGIRRQAKIGLGIVAEMRAEGRAGVEQQALLKEALGHYADAFTFEEMRRDDATDAFWYQKAGVEAARVAEALGEYSQALSIYRALQATPNLAPAVQRTLERGRLRVLDQINKAPSRDTVS